MAKSKFDTLLEKYDYELPESYIAQNPVTPRDSAKLLVYDRATEQSSVSTFKDLVRFLPKNSVIIFNKTKVIPARLALKKPTGGIVSILFLGIKGKNIRVLANKKLTENIKLVLNSKIQFLVVAKNENEYLLSPSFSIDTLFDVLEKYGTTPIPQYIKHTSLNEQKLRREYQTVFAKSQGSVAAPTAALHFTKELLEKIKNAGHEIYFITLHVNLGTFAKLTEEHVKTGKLHKEYYEIDTDVAAALNSARKSGKTIIAVGTTVVRTLESASIDTGTLEKLSGTTDLFITEQSPLKFVTSIITNFHVPKSSLLMLVAAFVGQEKLFELYRIAQEKKFRFFSFGDGMFVI